MSKRQRLHAEVDAEWQNIVNGCNVGGVDFWSMHAIFMAWRDEKVYVDRFGKRMPRIEWVRPAAQPEGDDR